MRALAILLLSLFVALPAWAQWSCNVTLNAGEEGNVTGQRGDVVTVCLPLNSGTGYSWQPQAGGDATTLQPTSTFERRGTMPGAAGVTRFTLKPQNAGAYALVFMLVPPGTGRAPAGRVILGLHVQ